MRYSVYSGVERFKTNSQKIMLATAALGLVAALVLAAIVPTGARGARNASNFDSDTVVVMPGDLAVDADSWYFYDDNTNTPSTAEVPGEYEFVEGPGDPPAGVGSVQFQPEGNDRWNIATVQHAGTKLNDIAYIKYQTYQPSDQNPGVNQNAAFLNIDIDFDGTDANNAYQNRLIFVPRDNGTVAQDEWQLWNAGIGRAQWRWSGYAGSGNMWPDGSTDEVRYWADIRKAFPNAEFHDSIQTQQGTVPGQLLFRAGEPYPGGFTGSVDKFVFGVGSTKTVYDFEPSLSPMSEEDCENRGWKRFNDPRFASEAECKAYVQANTCFQGFEENTDEWFNNGGAITRVASGSGGIASASGSYHAEATVPVDFGGVFTRWCGYENAFPANGYTTQVDVYVDMGQNAALGTDKRLDFSSAINQPDGNHRRDFIFHLGTDPLAVGQWKGSVSNNAPGWPSNPARSPVTLSDSGWYTLKSTFRNNAGVLAVDMELIKQSDSSVVGSWTLSDPSDLIGVTVGGNRYGWFVTSDFSFIATDNTKKVNL